MEEKILVLTPDDFYHTGYGRHIIGGSQRLFNATLAVRVDHEGQVIEIIKNRYDYSMEEVEEIIHNKKDRRLLLLQ